MKNFMRPILWAQFLWFVFLTGTPASAVELKYSSDDFSFDLTGYGTAGLLEPDFDTPEFIGDWRVRAAAAYKFDGINSIGAVYALDAAAVDENKFFREAFAYWQNNKIGRLEIGLTDSIARKLGVGLPDVGGLRVNDKPLFYKKITPDGPVISDTTLTTGRSAPRINIASIPIHGVQYGLSVSGLSHHYDYTTDFGIKIRQPSGKIKTAYVFGASFMSRPDGYRTDAYTPRVTADWRTQISGGVNVQYNSWMFGITGRLIYDENPIGRASDGVAAGAGVSYDILNYSLSLTYIFSDTDIWHHDIAGYIDHTAIASFRYKYSENIDLWLSGGLTTQTPFWAAGLRISF